MNECPYCGSDLNGSGSRQKSRAGGTGTPGNPGAKNVDASLISCPDCDGVIDGYSPH